MHGSVPIDAVIARNDAARSGQESFVPTPSGNILPGERWFMRIARGLWPAKPAAWLRYLTGFPERTCRAYASGDTSVSSEMLYALLRGEQGNRFYNAIMAGCEQPWWVEHQRAAEVGRRVLDITK